MLVEEKLKVDDDLLGKLQKYKVITKSDIEVNLALVYSSLFYPC